MNAPLGRMVPGAKSISSTPFSTFITVPASAFMLAGSPLPAADSAQPALPGAPMSRVLTKAAKLDANLAAIFS